MLLVISFSHHEPHDETESHQLVLSKHSMCVSDTSTDTILSFGLSADIPPLCMHPCRINDTDVMFEGEADLNQEYFDFDDLAEI